jgi:peptide/nickel transport system substrate-binding protein
MQDAIAAEATDPAAANRIWAEIDRRITDASAAVMAFNPTEIDLVSQRVGDVRFHPLAGLLLDQLWVR